MRTTVNRDQVLAFRLDSHNLARRLPSGSLLEAASACGVQNTPPGSAELSLHARVSGLAPGEVKHNLEVHKTLLQAWSLRGAPQLFPTKDAAIFTLGLLPDDEESTRFVLAGPETGIKQMGMAVTQLFELVSTSFCVVLDQQKLTKDELGIVLSRQIAQELTSEQLHLWQSPSWYVDGQSMGETLVRYVLPLLAWKGLCCHAERKGNQAYLARTDRWLGGSIAETDPAQSHLGLLIRYLHCYGPSTPGHFAEWAGISPVQAGQTWKLVEGELLEVDFERRKTWLLAPDLERLISPPTAGGIRFLPPHDPFLQLRDRKTLISDTQLQKQVWKTVGNPGVVLANGQFAGTWRSKKTGKRLGLTIEWHPTALKNFSADMEAEAKALAPFWGCETIQISNQ